MTIVFKKVRRKSRQSFIQENGLRTVICGLKNIDQSKLKSLTVVI